MPGRTSGERRQDRTADHIDRFAGRWRLDRRIDDRLSGTTGRFEGEAVLRPDRPGLLRYDEAGLLDLGGAPPMRATRTYLWRIGADVIDVLFADGRPFHHFDPVAGGAGTAHLCGADLYRVTYDLVSWPEWRAVWQVSGPRKDYSSASRYTRLASPPSIGQ